MKSSIAIIGAGISGLILAHDLKQKASVVIFEKAKGVGGRMATRYADPFHFDHGAQCFTARTKEFQNFLKPYIKDGIIQEWRGKVISLELGKPEKERLYNEPHLVASPNMNSLCKKLAASLYIVANTQIGSIYLQSNNKWLLKDKVGNELGEYDWIISTAPPIQTLDLFGRYIDETAAIRDVTMHGCYSLMLGFNNKWDRNWVAAKVLDNSIKWISINSTKPLRSKDVTCIVVHSANSWAKKYIDSDIDMVQDLLLKNFQEISGVDCSSVDYIKTHRWRYAIMHKTRKQGPYINNALRLAATSDWCYTSRIEEVWYASKELSQSLVIKS